MEINLPMNPPVNNNIQGNIYDKLDAITFEKVRVANSLLESKRSVQERIINKYRQDVERVHTHQTERLKREFQKIRKKKPDYVFDESDLTSRSKDRSQDVGRQRSLSESSNCSFCSRYYAHHFHVGGESRKKKKEKKINKSRRENDYFNMNLRLFFLNMMQHARGQNLNHQHHEDDQELPDIVRRDRDKVKVKPHSYDPRYPHHADNEERQKQKRSQSVETWIKEDEEICDELKGLDEYQDETDELSSSLNASKISFESGATMAQPKPKLSHSLNFPSCTSIPEESRMEVKEDKDVWKRSKRAFEKIFAGLL